MATRNAVVPISRSRSRRTPPVSLDSAERQLVQISRRYLRRAEEAHSARRAQNLINWDLYYLRQDWSHKRPWQSRVFLPDFPVAVQQIVTTLKRGLTDSDDWLDAQPVGLGDPILTEDNIRHMLLFYLDRLYMPGNRPDSARSIASALGDGLLHAVLESVITAKVYPAEITRKLYRIEQVDPKTDGGAHMLYEFGGKQLSTIDDNLVRLAIDILPFEAYLPDPGEAQLYDIHRVKRTIGQLRANPNYDPKVIDVLHGRAVKREEDQYRHRRQGTPGSYEIANPYEVVIDEFWGDVIDENTGEVIETNSFWALSDSLLLRPADVNPFWHGRRIFVSTPLARAPNAPTHPALADRVADVVRARNELDSLMLDGAFSEVWGTRQMRTDLLEDDSEVQDGVPQGYTAVLRPNVPEGLKFLERVDSGSIPQLALEMKRDLDASFQSGLGTPATAQGQLPPRSVKACVPMESEALTRRGWQHYEELSEGQEILAFNLETRRCEWTAIRKLYYYEAAETVRYFHTQWSVICTPDHKWVHEIYDYRIAGPKGKLDLTPIAELKSGQRIWTSAPAPSGSGLKREIGLYRDDLPELVLEMTTAERRAFIIGLLAGEGSFRPDNYDQLIFTQKAGGVLDAFRLACFLEGLRTSAPINTYWCERDQKQYTKHNSTIFQRPHVWRQYLEEEFAGIQPVWCPSTSLKTWVMRQGRTITITGNTEIVEVMAASGSMFEAIAAVVEDDFLEPVFELAWLTLLQFVGDLREPELIQILGPELILELQDMTAAERFQLLRDVRFRVRGLRGVASKQREFTKIMTVLQSLGVSPAMLELFDRTMELPRVFVDLVRGAGLDPVKYRRKEGEGALGGAPHVSEQLLLAGSGGSPPAEITAAAGQRGGLEAGMAPNRPAPTRA